MKLRIRDNSIRLRLMRGEVEALRDSGLVEASTPFPGGRTFRYAVESSPASVNPAAFYSDNAMIVRLPASAVLAWASSERVATSRCDSSSRCRSRWPGLRPALRPYRRALADR